MLWLLGRRHASIAAESSRCIQVETLCLRTGFPANESRDANSAQNDKAYSCFFCDFFISACSPHESVTMTQKTNPAMYFEIPVSDMKRAIEFYEKVFGFDFQLEEIHSNQMALMPFDMDGSGISGALAKGEIYKPSLHGTLIYLRTEGIDKTLSRASLAGAKVLFPKAKAGEYAYVAEIEDSEGNRIGLMELLL
jgi:predicted enzyme related to lactoylglutathione lyase